MLWAYVPPVWSVIGGVIAVIQLGIMTNWTRSYWGGAVALLGGALLYGALCRLLQREKNHVIHAVLFALGLLVLANSRPFEGLIVSVPALIWLAAAFARRWLARVEIRAAMTKRIVLPLTLVLVIGGSWMAYYNHRVTGNPFRLPWAHHYEQYCIFPVFLWQTPREEPVYHSAELRSFHTRDEMAFYHANAGDQFWFAVLRKLASLRAFYLSPALLVALLALPWIIRSRWIALAMVTLAALVVANLCTVVVFPHYAAPGAALLLLVVIFSLRRWMAVRTVGPVVTILILLTSVPAALCSSNGIHFAPRWKVYSDSYRASTAYLRQQVENQLREKAGQHIVLVRYAADHKNVDEWVYNGAEFSTQRVIWARELGAEKDQPLIEYCRSRGFRLWLCEPEALGGVSVVPYPRSDDDHLP